MNGKAKLTEDQVRAIRRRYQEGGISQADLAAEYGVSRSHTAHLVRPGGGRWTRLEA